MVTVLEANANRLGGRIKTIRSGFEDGSQYAEAGAMRLPVAHPLLNSLLNIYSLPTREFRNVDVDPTTGRTVGDGRIHCNGVSVSQAEYEQDPAEVNRSFGVADEYVNKTALEIFNSALEDVRDLYSTRTVDGDRIDRPHAEWLSGWAALIEKYDEYSMRRFLREEAHLGDNEITLIGTLLNLTSRLPLSFVHSFLSHLTIEPPRRFLEVAGGNALLVDALAADLEGCIVRNRRMTHLDYFSVDGCSHHVAADGPHISIRTISEEKDDGSYEWEIFQADLAIVAIPIAAMRFVAVEPEFPLSKRRAIIELHYDSATKVFLEFTRRWWEFTLDDWRLELSAKRHSGHISDRQYERYMEEQTRLAPSSSVGGRAITDNPNRFSFFPSHSVSQFEGGVVLASYTWADDARRWDSMGDKQRSLFSLRELALVHGKAIRLFFSDRAETQSWSRNPYALGEAAVFLPGQLMRLHSAVMEPVGPVFFAGEHTSLKHAWIEGALESSVRVALEVDTALSRPLEVDNDERLA